MSDLLNLSLISILEYADGSSVLLQVHIPIVPTERCIEAFKLGTDDHSKVAAKNYSFVPYLREYTIFWNALQICAGGDKGKDSCKGT